MNCRRFSFWVSGPNYQGAAAIGGLVALPVMAVNGPVGAALFVVAAGLVWWRSARQGVEVCVASKTVVFRGLMRTRVVGVHDITDLRWVTHRGDMRLKAHVGEHQRMLPGVGLPAQRKWAQRDRLWLSRCREFFDALVGAGVDPVVVAEARSMIDAAVAGFGASP
jgi:hypothetical protein